ncbi:MAG TPA: hypothetical protein PKV67_02100 [Hyphomonas sp.]|nr:hypothetical protein [Hyphomonas sp.]HRI99542.1 hypothetical protein [Hyphomonas sp.]HRK66373.1 hypothetical protein [Hyphomonas sp.]
MTHRIVNTFRSLALFGAVTLGLRKAQIDVREPEAIRSGAVPEDALDTWMFERPECAVSSEAFMLEREYGRVSGALASLRAVLTSLTRMPLEADADYTPVAAQAGMVLDPMLFEEAATAAPLLTNVVAFDEDDLFIEGALTLQKPSAPIESLSRVA